MNAYELNIYSLQTVAVRTGTGRGDFIVETDMLGGRNSFQTNDKNMWDVRSRDEMKR